MTTAAQPAAATPPEGERTDLVQDLLLQDLLLQDLARIETIFASWDKTQRMSVEAYRRAIDALHAEALRRLIRAFKRDPAALAAMKEAVADDIVYAVLRHHELIKPSLNERVEAALESVRPMLASHGGGVELANVAPPMIEVLFTGSCDGCAASTLTFHAGVKKAVEEACPEITQIVQIKGQTGAASGRVRFISPFAFDAKSGWLPAGVALDIPDGGLRALKLGGENAVLTRRGSAVSCFQDACAHLGLPLHEGVIEDGVITCPHHGFRYDLATGECLTAADVALQSHAVRLTDGRVEVRLSR